MASEMENLDLLEERIRRIGDLVRGLRRENTEIRARVREAEEQGRKSSETIAALQEEKRRSEEMKGQIRLLQDERQEIRGRVSRMLETFSSLDEIQPAGGADN